MSGDSERIDAGSGRQRRLSTGFYAKDAVTVARELLGCTLIHRRPDGVTLAGSIVETEAYRQDDPASHSHRGATPRTSVMFGPPGVAYVYFIYGMHHCFNVVCEPQGSGAAVLVRALEPKSGLEAMWRNRFEGTRDESDSGLSPAQLRSLASGPGKLCRAMGITRSEHDGMPLVWMERTRDEGSGEFGAMWIERPREGRWPYRGEQIEAGPRVGISRAADRPWRFAIAGSRFVSRVGSFG